MQLKNLVKYNQLIKDLDDEGLKKHINSKLSALLSDINLHEFDRNNLKEKMQGNHLEVLKNLEDLSYNLNKFRIELQNTIETLEEPYYQKSKIIYKEHQMMDPEDRRSRLRENDIINNDKSRQLLFDTINTYISNQYATLQISPGYGDVTKHILAGTPLYIADDDFIMLEQFQGEFFNEVMRRRTNYYVVNDKDEDPLNALPKSQIGFCVIVDYFNFKTVDIIEKYLKSLYNIMRAGGVVIFTFNNCDYPKGIDKVDEMYYCYTTESEMQTMCKELGFEIIKLVARDYDELNNGISWLEIKKPGELSTIRAGQGLAQIMDL